MNIARSDFREHVFSADELKMKVPTTSTKKKW